MDVTLTIRNASVQQLLNLRRPRRDRSPLRRQRPHIQILSNQQQDALHSHSVSRSRQEPLPRRRPDEVYEGTRANYKARPYSAFPRVRRASTASAASSSSLRPEAMNRHQAPGVGEVEGPRDIAAQDLLLLLPLLLHLHADIEARAEEDSPWSDAWRLKLINNADRDRCPAPWLTLMSACHTT